LSQFDRVYEANRLFRGIAIISVVVSSIVVSKVIPPIVIVVIVVIAVIPLALLFAHELHHVFKLLFQSFRFGSTPDDFFISDCHPILEGLDIHLYLPKSVSLILMVDIINLKEFLKLWEELCTFLDELVHCVYDFALLSDGFLGHFDSFGQVVDEDLLCDDVVG